ncbi:MAG: hypothetical protein WED04_07995 [Promethearchaeati archaeon SRVP18_Atabeyarchaeia-1]
MILPRNQSGTAFEKGLCWTLYGYYETDLIRFFEYVPYADRNRCGFSPKLLDLILRVCGYMDDVFKQMRDFPDFMKFDKSRDAIEKAWWETDKNGKKVEKDYSIFVARDAFESIYELSSNSGAELVAKSSWYGEIPLRPFEKFDRSKYGAHIVPDWWMAYNDLKHEWSSSIEKANVDNALNALAGAFLLNVVHYPSVKYLWSQEVLIPETKTHWGYDHKAFFSTDIDEDMKDAIEKMSRLHFGHKVETPLFRYRYQKP